MAADLLCQGTGYLPLTPAAGRAQKESRGYNRFEIITKTITVLEEVGAVKTVVLIMRRASLAQGLMAKAQNDPGFQLCYEPDYANADVAIRRHLAAGALVEVTEDGEYDMDFCLALCTWLREVTPDCRLTLMCPETQQETVSRAIAVKKQKLINDFVFYDVSLDYLAASLQSL